MSEGYFLTFQSQLSVVMETILKSAMFEITRLVEDSFLEEVGRCKQEVELLRRKLQLSESKLREREWERGKKLQCTDCGRTGDSSGRDESRQVETVRGLNLRDQSTTGPPLTEKVWSTRQQLEPNIDKAAHSHSKERRDVHKQIANEITTAHTNTNAQIPQDVLQRLLGNAAVHSESTCDFKPRVNDIDESEKDFTLDKEMDFSHAKLLQSPLAEDGHNDLAPSSPNSRVKSETELDLLPVKDEEEMVPVWDSDRDDGCHAEMADPSHGELRGSSDQEEIQVESFPSLNSLEMPDTASFFTPYSVNTLVHQSIRAQHSHLSTTALVLSSLPGRSNSLVQQENRPTRGSESSVPCSHDDVCPSGEKISHSQHAKHEQIHAERSHRCTQCGRTFVRACDLRAHMLIHKGKKPLNCTQCDQTFAYNFELKVHQQHHSGERPHVCPHCGKAFARLSNFKQHQNIHTREKLFSCNQCGMMFNRATNLRVHLRRHSHAGKSYNCPQCGKSFLGPRQMKAHLLKIHGRGGK